MPRNLPFLTSIIREIAPPETDDLLIVAKGLGLRKIVCTLLKIYDGEKNLVLLINASPDEENGIGELLGIMGVRKPGLRKITHEMPSKERNELYLQGGIFSITSRILIVDLLTKNVPTEMITGLMVLHAEKVNQTSQEAFIVRLYRQSNHQGFLKAFSDEPEHFNATMTPLQTCMKMLSLRRVTLWPRFHAEVHTSLGQRKADVIELYQPLTKGMQEIQGAIVECMDATLAEFRKSASGVDMDEMTVDNALFRNFDKIVRGQLDPVWHRVGPRTKRLVSDLTTLRLLLNYLLTYDSISFNSHLETILTSATIANAAPSVALGMKSKANNQSPWLYLDAANTLFHVAKRRAYIPAPPKKKRAPSAILAGGQREADEFQDAEEALRDIERQEREDREAAEQTGGEGGVWPPGVQPILEELPKWGLLAGVLEEIEEEIAALKTTGQGQPGTNTILIMASSDRTCSQLREYLTSREPTPPAPTNSSGPQPTSNVAGREMMERMLRTYFWWKGGLGDMSRNLRGTNLATIKSSNNEADRLSAGASREDVGRGRGSIPGQPAFKRRRVRAGSVAASVSGRSKNKGDDGKVKEEEDESTELLDVENMEIADFLHMSSQQFQDEGFRDGTPAPPSSSFARQRSMTPAPAFHRQPSMTPSREPSVPPSQERSMAPLETTHRPTKVPLFRDPSEGPSDWEGEGNIESLDIYSRPFPEYPYESSDAPLRSITPGINRQSSPSQTLLRPSAQDTMTEVFDPEAFDEYFGLLQPEDLIVVRPYKGDDDDQVLEELRPRFVVMYDPDPGFIRRIEVYRSSNPGLAVRVYFMMYVDSVEEQRYLSGLRKEKEAFQRLIREKGSMLLPITGDPRGAPTESTSNVETLAKMISTRMAGGASAAEAEPATVIVDMREFRSTLPNMLHEAGMLIVPVTLYVGDYILNPEMCVERKSLPDLIQSLASGRLYTQCEMMSVHYKIPILLIEFEEKKSFSLQSIADSKRPTTFKKDPKTESVVTRINDHEIQSKLVLLTLTFPRLRVIWSSSPITTADIFKDLKMNFAEPDAKTAILVGAPDGEEDDGGGNVGALDLLRNLPGVTGKNFRQLINKVASIEHLCEMSLLELEYIIGSTNARTLHKFLHRDVRTR
ncbi:Structure-specific endonuclease ERCC1-XPF, catalytic component XPF/ERCC4 [Phaffia rhodozyma]|uniref:Structure-specific endonuclease ERCC1-XPF, catalytic component XPF/ERCC4 n=1 Tax=Phaffia rhodozyma TaxID=264483 RepID=A0A0F7SPF1_PHARH|nr:Structure-specific endonuclease ERCC1-XPF, catalytic component XPF/ERCC4 [Phaffia rhodozyma]